MTALHMRPWGVASPSASRRYDALLCPAGKDGARSGLGLLASRPRMRYAVPMTKAKTPDAPSEAAKLFEGYWGTSFAAPGRQELTLEAFNKANGYDAVDVRGIAGLAVREIWVSRHAGTEHTVTRVR